MSQRLVELDSQVKAGGGTVVRMDKRTICSCCQQSRPPGYMLTRVGKVGRFCAHCVGERWVKSLPPEAESWSPEHVCRLLTGDASERVMGISTVLGYSERPALYGRYSAQTLPLGKSISVRETLLACVAYPGQTWLDSMVRFLAITGMLDVIREPITEALIIDTSVLSPAPMIKAAATMIGSTRLELDKKIRWLYDFRDHPDSGVLGTVIAALQTLGPSGFEEVEEALDLQPLIDQIMAGHKAGDLRNIINAAKRLAGIEITAGTTKADMALALARTLGTAAGMREFYDKLSPEFQQVVNFMAWQTVPVPPEKIEAKTGVSVVDVEQGLYTPTVRLKSSFSGLLNFESDYYQRIVRISLQHWLRLRLKPALPVPEKARLQGTTKQPNFPGARILQADPAFVSRFPSLDAMCQQGVIARKKNGTPTVAGLRALQEAGWELDEFYPNVRKLAHRRLEILVCLGDAGAATATAPRAKPAEVLCNWLDLLTKPPAHPLHSGFLPPQFMPQLKNVYHAMWSDAAAVCLESLEAVMAAVPKGQWVTLEDLHDFILYNSLPLPVPPCCHDAYLSVQGKWGLERQHLGGNQNTHWEKPLVRTFFMVLAAIGVVDAVIVPPEETSKIDPPEDYLPTTEALKAVRLTAVGEWYFQGGPETCLEEQAMGEVVLDERRLFIRLTGSNPVLEVALKQVAQPIGGGFYRIDGGSFLKDCTSEAHVQRKVDTLKSLLPDALPAVWEDFFENLLLRVNPLTPAPFTVLEVGESPEFRQLLRTEPALRALTIMAEGGRILVKAGDRNKLKKRLRDLGYFIDCF